MSKAGPSVEFVVTGDGSHTLYVPGLEENYHSVFGAIAESRHIFIEAGLKYVSRPPEICNILEIGFGTGLNAFLTLIEAENCNHGVRYTAIEKYPLDYSIYNQLNYPDLLGHKNWFLQLHELPWEKEVQIIQSFYLHKLKTSLENFKPSQAAFELAYFDAFGPEIQPDMWSLPVFKKIASGLKKGGVLVTYSTKGDVKRNLTEAGFSFEKLPGPPGKREILRATLL